MELSQSGLGSTGNTAREEMEIMSSARKTMLGMQESKGMLEESREDRNRD